MESMENEDENIYVNIGYNHENESDSDGASSDTPLLQNERPQPLYGDNSQHHQARGIFNTGHSCYMNSALQFTFAVPAFREVFLTRKDELLRKSSPTQFKFNEALCNFTRSLFRGSGKSTPDPFGCANAVRPDELQKEVCREKPQFSGNTQQDSLEFFLHLITLIKENYPEDMEYENPTEMFRVHLKEKIERGSNAPSYTDRHEYVLSCPIPEPNGDDSSFSSSSRSQSALSMSPPRRCSPNWSFGCRNLSTLICVVMIVLINAAVWERGDLEAYTLAGVIPYLVLLITLFFTPPLRRKKSIGYILCFFLFVTAGCLGFVVYLFIHSGDLDKLIWMIPSLMSPVLACAIILLLNRVKLSLGTHIFLLLVVVLVATVGVVVQVFSLHTVDELALEVIVYSFFCLSIYTSVLIYRFCRGLRKSLRHWTDDRQAILPPESTDDYQDSDEDYTTSPRVPLMNCLRRFMQREQILSSGDDTVYKQSCIVSYPAFIVIQPRLFVIDSNKKPVKLNDIELDVRHEIDLAEFMCPLEWQETETDATIQDLLDRSTEYVLKAFVNHHGTTARSGHYQCYVRQGDSWLCCDDVKVEHISTPPLQTGYLFLYQRQESVYSLLRFDHPSSFPDSHTEVKRRLSDGDVKITEQGERILNGQVEDKRDEMTVVVGHEESEELSGEQSQKPPESPSSKSDLPHVYDTIEDIHLQQNLHMQPQHHLEVIQHEKSERKEQHASRNDSQEKKRDSIYLSMDEHKYPDFSPQQSQSLNHSTTTDNQHAHVYANIAELHKEQHSKDTRESDQETRTCDTVTHSLERQFWLLQEGNKPNFRESQPDEDEDQQEKHSQPHGSEEDTYTGMAPVQYPEDISHIQTQNMEIIQEDHLDRHIYQSKGSNEDVYTFMGPVEFPEDISHIKIQNVQGSQDED